MAFTRSLLKWYVAERRDLPWRTTKDPYKIWVSEIILQQTRVDQGLEYYLRFIRRFPNVKTLATASPEDVLHLWQGLGYYSRARNMHAAAQQIMEQHDGVFPSVHAGALALRGIGTYTAAAILSIAFGQPWPVVDGNVIRVLSRYLMLELPADKPQTRRDIDLFLQAHIDKKDPGNFNQAMMELGALICKPRNPQCTACPVAGECKARISGTQEEYPRMAAKTRVSSRYFHYLVLTRPASGQVCIRQRKEADIWEGLYEFPMIEAGKSLTAAGLVKLPEWKNWFGKKQVKVLSSGSVIQHKLTHRDLHIRFFEIEMPTRFQLPEGWLAVGSDRLKEYPFPVVITRFLKTWKRSST